MFPVERVPQAQGLGSHVVDQLRVLIITGKLPPQTHLVESTLSSNFGVSRGPVRDALRQLEAEGLVESRRRGVFVVGLTSDDIDELYSLRESLEQLALRLSSRHAAPAEWRTLEEPLRAMHAAADAGAPTDFAKADLAFHSRFYELSRHRRLLDVWRQYEPTFAVLLNVTNAEDIDLHPSAEAHDRLLALVRERRLDELAPVLEEHLLGSRNRLRQAYARILGEQQPSMTSEPGTG